MKIAIQEYQGTSGQIWYPNTVEISETYKSLKWCCCSMKSPIEEIAHEISSRYLIVTHRTNAGNLHFDFVIWEPIVDDG